MFFCLRLYFWYTRILCGVEQTTKGWSDIFYSLHCMWLSYLKIQNWFKINSGVCVHIEDNTFTRQDIQDMYIHLRQKKHNQLIYILFVCIQKKKRNVTEKERKREHSVCSRLAERNKKNRGINWSGVKIVIQHDSLHVRRENLETNEPLVVHSMVVTRWIVGDETCWLVPMSSIM